MGATELRSPPGKKSLGDKLIILTGTVWRRPNDKQSHA